MERGGVSVFGVPVFVDGRGGLYDRFAVETVETVETGETVRRWVAQERKRRVRNRMGEYMFWDL